MQAKGRMALVLLMVVALSVSAGAAIAQDTAGFINVKDFGVMGDGVTDDSAALQALLNGLEKYITRWSDGLACAGVPEIYFPAGTYRISRVIFLHDYLAIRGEKGAVIKQSDPQSDIFYVPGWRARIEGLTFEGGRRALRIETHNIDMSAVFVFNCTFRDTSDYAIDCSNQRDADTYIHHDDGTYTYVPEPDEPNWYHNSTLLHMQGCEFINCMKALRLIVVDMAVLEDSTITTNPDMKGAAILTASTFRMENVRGYGHATEGAEQRWIDYEYSTLALRNVHFESVSGPGMCPIYNIRKPVESTITWGSIVLEDSSFDASRSPEKALIYCVEVPGKITVRNCREATGRRADILAFKGVPDAAYFGNTPAGSPVLAYTFSNNTNLTANLPESMRPYVRKPAPAAVDAFVAKHLVRDKDAFLSPASFKPSRQLNVQDFDVKGHYHTDNTDTLRACFREAAKEPGTEVVFPAGVYLVTETVVIPDDVILRAVGKAVIRMPEGDGQDIFAAESARNIAVIGFVFARGGRGLRLNVEPSYPAKVLIHDCNFQPRTEPAVTCISGDFKVDDNPAAKLRISDCVFFSTLQVLASNVNALVDNLWVTSYHGWGVPEDAPPIKDVTAFENKGILRVQNMCGVPQVPQGKTPQNGVRWIDNYGALLVDFVRFGGEGGGITCLVMRKSAGQPSKAVIQDGWVFGGPPVIVEKIPDLLAVRDNMGWHGRSSLYSVKEAAPRGVVNKVIFSSGNTFPEEIDFPDDSDRH
jgi:hypothetical protein